MKTYFDISIKTIFSFLLSALGYWIAPAQTVPFEPPIMGWSSWNTYRVHINEALIYKQTDALLEQGLKEAGYRYINVDDGFFGHRDEKGVLHTHPERFPNGMKPVADYIHSRGLFAGIYSEAGANTCGSIWDADKNGIGVGLYGFERQDADLFFNQWGFDFIKIDYCGAGQQLDLDEKERYTAITEAIREVSNRKVSLNICRWAYPGTWAKSLARSWRISADIYPAWESVKYIIDKNLYLAAYAGEGHYNDMDMLEIGRGLTPDEEQTHFGMWCIMSSPLLIGCDLTTLPSSSLNLLKNTELIALNQDPLGLQAHVAMRCGEGYVLVKDIERKRGTTRAAAFYNPSDKPCTFEVPLHILELQGTTLVRNLIEHKDEPVVNEHIRCRVAPHGIKIVRLDAKKRLEPIRYEAEHAYLHQYNDLGKRKRGVTYQPDSLASGGMTISRLGGHPANYAQWKDVYSEHGGNYRMRIYYLPAIKEEKILQDHRLEVTVNGKRTTLQTLENDRRKGLQTAELTIQLEKGYNLIRIGSRYTWTPDIDCFTLSPLSASTASTHE